MNEKASRFQTSEPEVLSRFLQMGFENIDAASPENAIPPIEQIDRFVAGYELLKELGRGGAGVVYLARQKNLGRLVALKVLGSHSFGDNLSRARFQREAELVATLQHPQIVRIYEFGISEGAPFYSMEYVEGTNLKERIQAAGVPWEQAVEWAASIAETVGFAHRNGVLHRDLKPENVLIDADGQLHLADFGLARKIEEARGLTLTGTLVGTPQYIAPEVISSYGGNSSAAADQYAIGAMLYQMLTGNPPFAGNSLGEIAENIRRSDPVPPSRKVSGIPKQLDAICLKALRKKPSQRYASTQELADALNATLPNSSHSGVQSRRTVVSRIPTKTWVLYFILVVFALSLGGLVFPEVKARLVVVKPWTNSLGMKFVPAGTDGVLFCIWDVRVKDFKAFVDATGYDATAGMNSLGSDGWKPRGDTWINPGFPQGDDYPVVGVSWNDAHVFCDWLTKKERAEGKLAANQRYRLPTDAEWSTAVGLKEPSGGTPEEKRLRTRGVYPWGTQWPPPPGAGNYDGVDFDPEKGIDNYRDGYEHTSPVGAFKANAYGLYDMGGNVWQWCEDNYNSTSDYKVTRGASWDPYGPLLLLSCYRHYGLPDNRGGGGGFRVVLSH